MAGLASANARLKLTAVVPRLDNDWDGYKPLLLTYLTLGTAKSDSVSPRGGVRL